MTSKRSRLFFLNFFYDIYAQKKKGERYSPKCCIFDTPLLYSGVIPGVMGTKRVQLKQQKICSTAIVFDTSVAFHYPVMKHYLSLSLLLLTNNISIIYLHIIQTSNTLELKDFLYNRKSGVQVHRACVAMV